MKDAQGIAHLHLREKRQRNEPSPPNPACRLAGAWLQMIDFHQYAAIEILGELSHGLDRFGQRPKRSSRLLHVCRATPDAGADLPSRDFRPDRSPASDARQPGREFPTARILPIPAADGSNVCSAEFPGSSLTSCLSICLTNAGCQAIHPKPHGFGYFAAFKPRNQRGRAKLPGLGPLTKIFRCNAETFNQRHLRLRSEQAPGVSQC